MAARKCSDEDFIEVFEAFGAEECARRFKMAVRSVYGRRSNIEKRIHRQLVSPNAEQSGNTGARVGVRHPARVPIEVENGIVLIGSDAHYWPNYVTTAHRAFVKFCKELKPKAVILNGDVLDGATVSRFPPIGWETRPMLVDEIEACKERLDEIKAVAKNARLVWTLGNHDGRFETRLATVAPEYAKVHGVHLKDHFPEWWPGWSCWINGNICVKHRFRGGMYARRNNTLNAGVTMATGHTHKLGVTHLADYRGLRWGVETGTLADPNGPQFIDYSEDSPKDMVSGFVVFPFVKGVLQWPEIVYVIDEDHVGFRGEVISV